MVSENKKETRSSNNMTSGQMIKYSLMRRSNNITSGQMIKYSLILLVLIFTLANFFEIDISFDNIPDISGPEELKLDTLHTDTENLRGERERPQQEQESNRKDDIPHTDPENLSDQRERPQQEQESNRSDDDEHNDASSLVAFSNTTTVAVKFSHFYSGFRNQIMSFTSMVFQAQEAGHGQILLDSLRQKDHLGSNKYIPWERLWDVPHWNSYYPRLPRLVRHDPVLHDQWDPVKKEYYYNHETGMFMDSTNTTAEKEATRPYVSDKQHRLFSAYLRYSQGNGPFAPDGHRNPMEILMSGGALRPHPKLRNIIDGLLSSLNDGGGGTAKGQPVKYLTLHSRIEPDMQHHHMCKGKKVLRLKEIFDWMEEKWPEPPFTHIFMPINRAHLEEKGGEEHVEHLRKIGKEDRINEIAVENLRELNRAGSEGLWQGRVKVFDFGTKALADTEFSDRAFTTGALIDFFIAIGGSIFVGTEVSSYSHDIVATRFFRNLTENYKFLPDGLHHWTPPGLVDPPGFDC